MKPLLAKFFCRVFLFFLCLSPGLWGQDSPRDSLESGPFTIFFHPEDRNRAVVVDQVLANARPRLEGFFRTTVPAGMRIELLTGLESEQQERNLPRWAGALYLTRQFRILINPPQQGAGLRGLEENLTHELVHLYTDVKLGIQQLPLWYVEGLAEYFSGETIGLGEGITLSHALAARQIMDLDAISGVLGFSANKANLAYLQSLSAVMLLRERFGADSNWQDFHDSVVISGWATAFPKYTGMEYPHFNDFWYETISGRYRWLVLFNAELLFWVMLLLGGIAGFVAVKIRTRRKLRHWAREDSEEGNWEDRFFA